MKKNDRIGILLAMILISRLRRREYEYMSKEEGQILEFMRARGEISNEDIRNLLKVSDSTAVRYMDKLEEAGKVVQVGKAGRFVRYKLK